MKRREPLNSSAMAGTPAVFSPWRVKIAASLFAILWLIPNAWSQSVMGTVSGTVKDQSGGVIPNAPVIMTNQGTNEVSTARTNEVGFYFFPTVSPGSYLLSIEVAGMQSFQGTLAVQVGQSAVVNPVLKPGQTSTHIEVKDVTPLVTVDNGTLSLDMERSRIEQLPINGRNLPNLMATVPGYQGERMFGSQVSGTEWSVNGVVLTERRGAATPPINVALDSVQEFVVQSNAVSAKFARPVGILISTRSGTNGLHGDLFATNRNNGVGLARSRTDFYTKAPELNRNEYGGSLGGPVVIPGLYNGKDKTFWFTSFEGQQLVAAATCNFAVPTPAMRDGNFGGLTDAQGRLQVIYNPFSTGANWSRAPFPGNAVPTTMESPLAKYLFSITPLPTNNANPLVGPNWFGPQYQNYQYWQMNSRFDQRITDRDQFHVVFTASSFNNPYFQTSASIGQQMLNGVYGWETDTDYLKSTAATWTHIMSPTLSNELTVSARTTDWTGGENDLGVNWPDKLGLPNPFHTNRVPQISGMGLEPGGGQITATPGAVVGVAGTYNFLTNDTKENRETIFTLNDDLVKVHGKHEFLFGFQARREYLNILPQQRYPAPQLNFTNSGTALYDPASTAANPQVLPNTGAGMANMYLGLASYTNNLSHNFFYLSHNEFAPYFQDNFKVNSRLTLNLGVRWEHQTPYHEKNGTLVGFDQAHDAVVLSTPLQQLYALGATYPSLISAYQSMGVKFESTQQAGLPYDQVHSAWRDFSPRAGFAYKALDGRSSFVIRGGYSISYFPLALVQWIDNNRQNFPLSQGYSYNPDNTAQTYLNDGLANYMARSVPTVIAGVNTSNIVSLGQVTGVTPGNNQLTYFSPNQPDSLTHTWNVTLEKAVTANTVVRVRYIGSHSANLSQNYNYNSATPAFIWYASTGLPVPTGATSNIATRPYDSTSGIGNIQEFMRTGRANANGMEAEIQRRFSKGIAFQWSYTMMNAFAATGGVMAPNQYLPGVVPTDYDARNSLLNYARDIGIPKHEVKWNWLIDLPFGRGKKIGGNVNKVLDKFIGGWQLAGVGQLNSTYFTLSTANWNFTGAPIESYGYKYPIQNCTSGVCQPGYLWTNAGYISANQINATNSAGKCIGICGIPSDYKPAETPLIPWGSTALPPNAPAGTVVSQFWDTNTVWVPLKNGTVVRTTYGSGYNPWQNQYMGGPLQWGLDASLFKVVPITERFRLRLNADFFNVLNHPGNPNNVSANGILNTQSSGQAPRTLQLTLRLEW